MKIISHRGNLDGPNIGNENKKDQISACIDLGLDIEIDLWRIDEKFFLGHDDPETEISEKWLLEKKNYLWIHCKNLEGLEILIKEFSSKSSSVALIGSLPINKENTPLLFVLSPSSEINASGSTWNDRVIYPMGWEFRTVQFTSTTACSRLSRGGT